MCVRIRPGANASDMSLYDWRLSNNDTKLVDGSDAISTPFYFDRVFRPDATTEQVYATSIQHVVRQFTAGFNGTIFAVRKTQTDATDMADR